MLSNYSQIKKNKKKKKITNDIKHINIEKSFKTYALENSLQN